jgi:hypothetical protein
LPVVLALWNCGCPNANTYTAPRTLSPGDVQAILSPEALGFRFRRGSGSSALGGTPTLPSFGLRYGLADRLEIGARLSSLFSPAVDLKWLLLRGSVDVALDPAAQYLFLYASGPPDSTESVLLLQGPVLVGFNLSSTLTLVASAGAGYALATPRITTASDSEFASGAGGALARLGFGVDIRTGRRFALHPEVTVVRVFDDAQTYMGVLGVGFNFGSMPDYSDLEPQE